MKGMILTVKQENVNQIKYVGTSQQRYGRPQLRLVAMVLLVVLVQCSSATMHQLETWQVKDLSLLIDVGQHHELHQKFNHQKFQHQ